MRGPFRLHIYKALVENKFVTKLIYTKMMYSILLKLFVKILILTRNIFDTHLNQFYKNGHTIMEFKKSHLLAIDMIYLIFIS